MRLKTNKNKYKFIKHNINNIQNPQAFLFLLTVVLYLYKNVRKFMKLTSL